MKKEPKFKVGDEVVWDNPNYKMSLNYGSIFTINGVDMDKRSSSYVYDIGPNRTFAKGCVWLEDCFTKASKLHKALL